MFWAGSNPWRQKTQSREVEGRNQVMVNTMFTAVGKALVVEQKIFIFHWSGWWAVELGRVSVGLLTSNMICLLAIAWTSCLEDLPLLEQPLPWQCGLVPLRGILSPEDPQGKVEVFTEEWNNWVVKSQPWRCFSGPCCQVKTQMSLINHMQCNPLLWDGAPKIARGLKWDPSTSAGTGIAQSIGFWNIQIVPEGKMQPEFTVSPAPGWACGVQQA